VHDAVNTNSDTDFMVQSRNETCKNSAKNSWWQQRWAVTQSPPLNTPLVIW